MDAETNQSSRDWWREPEILGLVLLVAIAYFFRVSDAPLRGEETRWVLVAQEMAESGDWIVPRQQNEPFLNRPPLHCWLIAATGLLRGQWNILTFRLPSLAATLLGGVLVYGYGRQFLSRLGAFSAAAALLTMAELLQTCRLAETDAVFIPLVAASLLVWHWGYSKNWPAAFTWSMGYALMALAALTKGPQAPIYFAGPIGTHLVVTGAWRRLFSLGHLLGILVAAGIVAAWFVPLALDQGWSEALVIWTGQTALRMQSWTVAEVAQHMALYPWEVLGCTMPWSLLLLAFFSRRFRDALGPARPAVVFLAVCLAVTFPTCWIPPGARSRYWAPMYPCLALLIGLVIQRCAEASLADRLHKLWRVYVYSWTTLIALGGIAIVGAAMFGDRSPALATSGLATAFVYAVGAIALAWTFFRSGQVVGEAAVRTAVCTLACFMGLIVTNVVTDYHRRTSPDTADDVAQVRRHLPHGATLVSLDSIHHRFAYFFGNTIDQAAWPKTERELPDNLDYFCFDAPPAARESVPFPWEEVGVISMERRRREQPREVVVIGRRLRTVNVKAD